MLPKGNVSKHHARLLFRDGRFIVTDLKSTNGTYVNGRKIAQATIVREGDKIYIGDFVLRLETNGQGAPIGQEPTAAGGNEEESIRTLARDQANRPNPLPNPPAVTLKAPTHPPGAPLPRPQPQNVSNAPSPIAIGPAVGAPAPGPRPQEPPPPQQGFNLDHDPDDSAPLQKPRVPSAAPPAGGLGGGGMRPMTMPLNQMSPPVIGQRVPTAPPGGALQSPLGPPPGAGPPPIAMPPIAQPPPQRAPEPPPPLPPPAPIERLAPPPQIAPQPLAPPP